MKRLVQKYREIILYLVFGVLTTVISWAVYFVMITLLGSALGADGASGEMQLIRAAANTVSWVAGVLFAFITNKTFVFEDKNTEKGHMLRKLLEFSSSRLLTLLLEIVVVWGSVELLFALGFKPFSLGILGFSLTVTIDLTAKLFAAVLVVVSNYILSKLLVFRKK